MSDRFKSDPPPASVRAPRSTSSPDLPAVLSESGIREIAQNAALVALLEAGIGEGVAALGDTREDIEVLLLIDLRGQRQTTRFLDFVGARALEAAKRLLLERSTGLERFAIVQRGEVPWGAGRSPAVLVDAADAAMRSMVRYAQRVSITSRGVHREGAPVPVGALASPLDAARAIIVECPSCKAKNRVPLSRVKDTPPRCGGCKESLAS